MGNDNKRFEGITVDGKPLINIIEKGEEDEKTREIEEERREAVRIPHKRQKPWGKRTHRGRSGKAIKLTDEQIRKEYGLMKKPFATVAENVLYTMITEGPISTRDIAQKLNMLDKVGSISAATSTIWKYMGGEITGVIKRDSVTTNSGMKAFEYYISPDYADRDPDKIVDLFRRESKRTRRKERLGSNMVKADLFDESTIERSEDREESSQEPEFAEDEMPPKVRVDIGEQDDNTDGITIHITFNINFVRGGKGGDCKCQSKSAKTENGK